MNKLKRILLLSVFLVTSCLGQPENTTNAEEYDYVFRNNGYVVYRIHDDEKEVTCWLYGSYGISCLPDGEIK